MLNRCIKKFLDLGEHHDFVELPPDLCAGHAEDRAVEIDVFPTGELRVETSAHFEQACDASPKYDPTSGRLSNTA